jgi:hypothetical protein
MTEKPKSAKEKGEVKEKPAEIDCRVGRVCLENLRRNEHSGGYPIRGVVSGAPLRLVLIPCSHGLLAETGTMFSLSCEGPYKPLPLGKLVLLGCKRDRRAAPRHPIPLAGILGLA